MADNAPTGNTCGYVARWNDAGSSGDTGTIDDNYRSIWSYIWGNPEALTAMVRPLTFSMIVRHSIQGQDTRKTSPSRSTTPRTTSVRRIGRFFKLELER